ncbi:sensor histidine kinase [Sphingomonas rubra]|uniref:histidine kinase n=1 Tax=Sphingomonas rubra TaxID=634430 RepID=A0A1I5QMV5_9SPHN|nr:ATP-binding protein [Sphingomonas rubra]SFP47552.1 Signal transduction histidine kinase [Sphingomonas rubra]
MSIIADRRGRAPSIAWPIFALVVASVMVAAATIFAVTFNGPPPRRTAQSPAVVSEALRTGMPPRTPGPELAVRTTETPPRPDRGFRADQAARRTLATMLGVREADVVAYTMRPMPEEEGAFGRDFVLGWRTGGQWRIAQTPRPWLAPWHLTTLLAMLIAVVALAVPAWFIAQAISRPVRAVARAAERARAGAELPALPTGGAREVRALSTAVAAMHARLAAHAEGRTTMLAAIAHDLGTPLSRLAFRVEQLPEPARERAAADITEMRGLIAAALSFARDEAVGAMSRLDLGSLLESLGDDMAEAGAAVTVAPGARAIVRGDPVALRRLFANLLGNAVRYGDRAEVSWRVAGDRVTVVIDDHGPGVDPAGVERLFEPFVRGDPSRNRATGGTGLGLAIVRSVAARHDGEAVLENGPSGGQARVVLPIVG